MKPLCHTCLGRLEAAARLGASAHIHRAEVCGSCARKILDEACPPQAEAPEPPMGDPDFRAPAGDVRAVLEDGEPPPTERFDAPAGAP